ncbi:hypothetical protein ACP70R_003115 [Stipagrostis hirtigluma subsp. patula]
MPEPTTVSTCTLGKEQGKHVFRIVGYSHQGGSDGDSFIWSGSFLVGGHRWVIAFNRETPTDSVILGLILASGKGGPKVRASYELRLVDQSTGLSSLVHEEAPRTFDPDDRSRISLQAKKRSVFEASDYLRDDCLTIECIVIVFREPVTSETKSFPKIEVPPSDIAEQFGKLLEEKEGVDVTFSVGGDVLVAQKIVLATLSPVFRAELYGPMSTGGTEPIIIEDLQPEVFRALLCFIYTDSLPAMDDLEGDDRIEMVRHLLVAADRYAVERLKLICQSILCENLHAQTVATSLALADQHHCDMLKEACIEFITCSNAMDALAATPRLQESEKNLPICCNRSIGEDKYK